MPLPRRLLQPLGVGLLLDLALRAFAVTGAGLAFFMGRFLLAAALLAIAAGISLRLWRARRRPR